ncbi:MAG: cupin domain-containing protein [Rhodothermaceae bacterium]|nr:cupin domain-containing protein [Rhodothermaceae bacterium]
MDKNFSELISYSESGILSKVIVKNEKMNITLFSMAAGTEISGHTSTKSGFVYVIEGDGQFNLEGKEIVMSAGTFIYMDANAVHSLKAKENTSFVLVLSNN